MWDLGAHARSRGWAQRDRHRLVHDAVVRRRRARRAPSRAARRSARSGTWIVRDHPRARRARPRCATAKRTSCAPSVAHARLGQHGQPVALPEPAASSGYSRTAPTTAPSTDADDVQRARRVVALVAVVAREQPLLRRRTRARRTAKCAASSAAPRRSRSRRRASDGADEDVVLIASRSSRRSTRSHADSPEHAWQRAQPAFASRWSKPASASIADTSRVDRGRRSRASGGGASAISVPGTGRSGTTNG